MRRLYTPNFSSNRNGPCPCGSETKFKSCCGSLANDGSTPRGIQLTHNICDSDFCNKIVNLANQSEKDWLNTITVDPVTKKAISERDAGRITQGVNLATNQEILNDWIKSIWLTKVQPAFDVEIEWFERPDLLCYSEGGLYGVHADSDVYDASNNEWTRGRDRDLSMLVYINSEFEGGNIHFERFDYSYKPKAADLLIFPSDHRYLHNAEKVTSGIRYCIVSWAAVKGGKRVLKAPPAGAIKIKPSWRDRLGF